MECVCPLPAALPTIPKPGCKQNFGQIQRVLFQRAGFVFDAAADPTPNPIDVLSSWTPLFAAVGDTKVVSSPLLANFIIPSPEPITEGGGDNTTIDGIEIVLGAGAITATGSLEEIPGSIVKKLKELMCETDLVAYFINHNGSIIANRVNPDSVGPDDEQYTGFPISSLFVPDLASNGLNTRDKAEAFRFSLTYGWRDNAELIKPAFNAKTSLWPA
jgi:hypothetical protein